MYARTRSHMITLWSLVAGATPRSTIATEKYPEGFFGDVFTMTMADFLVSRARDPQQPGLRLAKALRAYRKLLGRTPSPPPRAGESLRVALVRPKAVNLDVFRRAVGAENRQSH